MHVLTGLVLFAVLVAIAAFVRDRWIRPYGGDLLVVIWLYHCLRAVVPLDRVASALIVLGFALGIEAAQAMQVVELLGLKGNRLAEIVIGTTGDLADAAMYLVGAVIAVLTDPDKLSSRT
jgi:hypothetical protein